jgi:hypothetical protein
MENNKLKGDMFVLPTTANDRTDHDVTDEDTEVGPFSGKYNYKSGGRLLMSQH